MNYLVSYYSGAGNTECIARRLADILLGRGHSTQVLRITEETLGESLDDFGALVLGFPVYFRRSPTLVREWLSGMEGQGRQALFFATKGMYSGNAMREIFLLAMRQGFEPKGFREFYMPGSDALLLFCSKGSLAERFFMSIHSRRIDAKINRLVDQMDGGEAPGPPGKKWYTPIDEKIVRRIEIKATDHYRIFVGRFFSMKERCTGCMLCVENCPRGNILMTDDGISFGENCDTCFRCVHHCPVEALQIGEKTLHTTRYRPKNCDF